MGGTTFLAPVAMMAWPKDRLPSPKSISWSLTQVPPTSAISMSATRAPRLAAMCAAGNPPCPAPITTTS